MAVDTRAKRSAAILDRGVVFPDGGLSATDRANIPDYYFSGAGAPSVDGLHVYAGFGYPTTTPIGDIGWTEIDVRVPEGITTNSGRSTEFDRFQAGSFAYALNNETRDYDSLHAAGPYYGQLKIRTPCKIEYVLSGTTYPVVMGYIREWPQTYLPGNTLSIVPINGDDAFRLLNLAETTDALFIIGSSLLGGSDKLGSSATLTIQLTGERVDLLLDRSSWPTADRDIDTGQVVVTATLEQGRTLAALQSVEELEDAQLYIDATGKVRFEDHGYRLSNARSTTSQLTFGDGPGEHPYTNLVILPETDKYLRNDVRRTRTDGIEQTASDDASIHDYYRVTDDKSGLNAVYDTQMAAQARHIRNRYSQPQFRIEGLSVFSGSPGANLASLLGLRISDRVTVKRRPQGVGDAIDEDCWIEGIAVTIGPLQDQFRFDFNLSPADPNTYFIIGSSLLAGSDVLA